MCHCTNLVKYFKLLPHLNVTPWKQKSEGRISIRLKPANERNPETVSFLISPTLAFIQILSHFYLSLTGTRLNCIFHRSVRLIQCIRRYAPTAGDRFHHPIPEGAPCRGDKGAAYMVSNWIMLINIGRIFLYSVWCENS
jgi:hypothetical protein